MSYTIEQRIASKNGWFTPAESRSYYGRYDRHGITWHWWGDGTGASNHDNIVNYMLNGAAAGQKSVNYVLSDNKITLLVGPDNVAWTAQTGNPVSVQVELQPTLQGEGYKKAGWLASELAGRYGGDRKYYPHNYWFSTQCPGTISLDRIRQEEDKWQRGEYNPAPTPAPAPAPSLNYVAKVGKARVSGTGTDGLYILKGPHLNAAVVKVVPEGTIMDFVGYVTNGDNVEGNTKWWKNAFGSYFSSRYAIEYVAPAPTPVPIPTPPKPTPPTEPIITPTILVTKYTLMNAKLVDIKTMAVMKTFEIDTPIDVGGETTWNGNKFYLTKWAVENKKVQGFLVGDLKANKEPAIEPVPVEPEQPEWVKNLRDIDNTEYWITEDTELIDITTGRPNDVKSFLKNDSFVASALTAANGKEYRITEYSYSKGIYQGVPLDKLTLTKPGVPDIKPIPDYPEYIHKSIVITFLESLVKLIQEFITKLRS